MVVNGHEVHLIEELYAWVAVDEHGVENVSAILRGAAWWPLVSKQLRVMRHVRPDVVVQANAAGVVHRLVRIGTGGREVLDEIHPAVRR